MRLRVRGEGQAYGCGTTRAVDEVIWTRALTHLSCDCRVQITPQLLEIRVWRVFNLKPLLSKKKQCCEQKENKYKLEYNT